MLVPWPAVVAAPVIVIVALAPLARVPIVQVTALVPEQPPWLEVAATNDNIEGRVSATVTPLAD